MPIRIVGIQSPTLPRAAFNPRDPQAGAKKPDIVQRVIEIAREYAGPGPEINATTELGAQLGFDSLDWIEFIRDLSVAFKFELPEFAKDWDHRIEYIHTVGDAVSYVQKRLSELDKK